MAERRREPQRYSASADARAAAEAADIVDQMRADFQERDRLLEATEAVLWSTYELNVPDAYRTTTQEVRSPLQLNIASTIAAALSTNGQNIAFEPIGQTQKAELNAELREHFFEASWRRQEHEARRQLLRVFLWSLVTKGEGVLKTVERSKRAWQGYTAYGKRLREELEADGALTDDEREQRYDRGTEAYKQGQPYPIASTDVVPESFYYYLTPDGIRYAAEVQDVPYLEALDRFGAGVDRNGNVVREEAMGLPRPEWSRALGGARTITCVELWDYRSCFPDGTLVGIDTPLKAVSRRFYDGPLVEIVTARGHKLAATPNHPILTPRGWVAAGQLEEGQEVISRLAREGEVLGDPDGVHPVAPIDEVFDLCARLRKPERGRDVPVNFHHDGQDGEVDVVAVDGELWDCLNAALVQPRPERHLAFADGASGRLAGQRGRLQRTRGAGAAAQGTALRRALRAQLLGADVAVAQAVGLAEAAVRDPDGGEALAHGDGRRADAPADLHGGLLQVDVAVPQRRIIKGEGATSFGRCAWAAEYAEEVQSLADRGDRDAQVSGDTDGGVLERDVAPDQILSVKRRAYAGHVYNLETESHRYRAQEIIVHNCRYFLLSGNQLGKANGRQLGTGTLVRHIRRHGYGDPYCKVLRGPYFHALGITTASRLPERAGLSVLYPFLSLFKALDSYLTIQSNAAYQTGFPSFKRTQPPGSSLAASLGQVAGPQVAPFGLDGSERDALAAQVTRIEPGSIYPWDVAPIEQPRAGADLDKIVAAIRAFLELALPSAVQGVVAGDMSGYALNQAAHLARLAWDPILKNAQVALSDRVGFESWLIERKVGERVYAWGEVPGSGARVRRPMATQQAGPAGWLGVGPEELGGSHRYTVTLEPDIPSDRALEVRTHVELVQAGFETTAMAIEALGGDPGEVERGLILENVKRSEFVQSRLMQRIQQGLGMMDAQELATIGAGPDGMPQLPPEMQAMLAAAGGVPPGAPPGLAGPAGAASPGLNGIGGFGTPLPGPLAPGMGMPLQPTPQGSVGGMGPPGAVPPNGANIPGGLPGTPSGTPVIPSPPANARSIPGRS